MRPTKIQVKKMPIGQLAARVPYAAQLFHKYQLDFCCRGNQPLADACRRKGADEREVLAELQYLMRGKEENDWGKVSNQDLIRHILDGYHSDLRACVPEIIRLARKVEAVHANHKDCPSGLTQLLSQLWKNLEAHMEHEEQVIFPWIKAHVSEQNGQPPLQKMMKDHMDQGEEIGKVRRLCRGFVWPKDACPTWKALYVSLDKLEEDLMEHIHVENNILFERVLHLQRAEVTAQHG